MTARSIHIRGVVQGVGFRPFVYRLARANALTGWVSNQESGVAIHLEGEQHRILAFLRDLEIQRPPASQITAIDVFDDTSSGATEFTIRQSEARATPTTRISPDLPVCEDCLREMRAASDPRYRYPYINCTNCGPRYSLIERLPYDRANTTMTDWEMDTTCAREYADPGDRRFHAQPVACPACGPQYRLGQEAGWPAIVETAALLRSGALVAIKGIGGYHLVCDARNGAAVADLRNRKYRKEKPFALMAATLEHARGIADLDVRSEELLQSTARPIVLAGKKCELAGVAPDTGEYGVMLPYAPLHFLLFDAGAPDLLVMTSGNRSSEPIAYRDDEALERLSGIADFFLAGERRIARRVDDSVVRCGPLGPVILRRSRGYAPAAVTTLPTRQPILALGADLKNSVTLVVDGQAFVSQHVGDLDDYESQQSFRQTIADLTTMYGVDSAELVIAYDCHPQYFATSLAGSGARAVAIQHHRAHIASVLAERQAWSQRVIGVSFDGTGYGDDGTTWGGEFFVGSIARGLERVMHLRTAVLAGGDAAARHPVQAAAGFLTQVAQDADLAKPPFHFPERYRRAAELVRKGVRVFPTTSAGRLFDTAAALLGFTREISFEGQAAMWLEHLAAQTGPVDPYPFPLDNDELDFRPLLARVVEDRSRGREASEIANAFHRGIAKGICDAAAVLAERHGTDILVLSGGVFQNQMLLREISEMTKLHVWTNAAVPPNDGGISLGQAALAAFHESRHA